MKHLLPTTTAAAALIAAALFVSATGGAVAGSLITGKQIKDGSVTGKDLKDRSVASADLAPGTLVTGPAGAPGLNGVNGVSGLELVESQKPGVAAGASGVQALPCPAGKKVVGASGGWEGTNRSVQLLYSPDLTKAFFFYENYAAFTDQLDMQVLCVRAAP